MKIKYIDLLLVKQFKAHLKIDEKAENTIEKYIRDVNRFIIHLNNRSLCKDEVIKYKKILVEEGFAVRSINSIISSLNCFFNFINRQDCKIKSIKIQREVFLSDKKELTKAEYIRLINTAKINGNERLSILLQTICGTGIRVSELQFITVDAVKAGKATVTLKGKTRIIIIAEKLKRKLIHYLSKENIKDGIVFRTRTGKPISRTNIWKEMKKLCESANVNADKVYPHNLRHLFARAFYEIEKDIAKLAAVLGHSSINTTRIYIMATVSKHIDCIEKMQLII